MKIALIIVFSLLMAVTQSVFTAQSFSTQSATCACVCEKSCCIRNAAPASQPAAPARPVSQNFQSQLFLAVLAHINLLAPATPTAYCTAFSASSLSATAIPLYQRNCSYLI